MSDFIIDLPPESKWHRFLDKIKRINPGVQAAIVAGIFSLAMHTREQMGDVMEKWERCIAREKAVVVTAFFNECGEQATWEERLKFLHTKHQLKGFEWTLSVD